MSEKRFTLRTNSVSINYPNGRIFDNKKQHSLYLDEVVFVLNEQQDTIQRMKNSLNTIYKAFEKHYGYDMRNAVWLIDESDSDE